jgi:hypothetical protein
MLWYGTGTSSEGSSTGKSLRLCAANISTFGSGEVANKDQLISGITDNYSEAIQVYLTHPTYSLVSTT